MQELHESLPSDRFELIGVSMSDIDQQDDLRSAFGLTYYLGIDDGKTFDAYDVQVIPTLVLVSPDRRILYRGHDLEEVRSLLATHIRR